MARSIYVGLDVHKDSTTINYFESENGGNHLFTGKLRPGAQAIIQSLKQFEKKLPKDDEIIYYLGYEAGCTGDYLCRDLLKQGYHCVIMAPNSIFHDKNGKVKNDRRDAQAIAKALATGQFKAVELLDEKDLQVREFIRTRSFHLNQLNDLKRFTLSLCLRYGKTYPGKTYWTLSHWKWLRQQEFPDPVQESFDSCLAQINQLESVIDCFTKRIEQFAQEERYSEKVKRLICLKGIKVLSAMTILTEIGDFNRFPTAKAFSAYLGLLPGEGSSGSHHVNTGITKEGNKKIRSILTEAANALGRSNPYYNSKALKDALQEVPPDVAAYAQKCNLRLGKKFQKRKKENKNWNKTKTAIAQELACFIWGMLTGHTD